MFPNFSAPNKQQLINALAAMGYVFVSAFVTTVALAGGIQSTWEATVALVISGGSAGVNAVLYLLYVTFFKKSD